jgi:CIC family chloride channel protein
LTVEQAMRTDLPFARLSETAGDVMTRLERISARTLAVVDDEGRLQGVVGRRELASAGSAGRLIADVARRDVVTVFPDQSLDLALLKLGRHSVRQAPVIDRDVPTLVVGMLSLEDISAAVLSHV